MYLYASQSGLSIRYADGVVLFNLFLFYQRSVGEELDSTNSIIQGDQQLQNIQSFTANSYFSLHELASSYQALCDFQAND